MQVLSTPAATLATGAANAVLVTTPVPRQRTAWTKARRDVMHLTQGLGYGVLPLPERLRVDEWCGFLAALHRRVRPGGRVLVEYPFDQRRRLYPLVAYCRWRGLRLQGLIHDLDALRFDAPVRRETAILELFDGLISHNAAMTIWLRKSGVTRPIAELGLFDYLTEGDEGWPLWHAEHLERPLRVVAAGNLSRAKARYLYDPRWAEVTEVEVSLFGAFFEPAGLPAASPLKLRGSFAPDLPALDGRYHFGLVWDGDSLAGGEGRYGRYLRFNNPHKLSLYAALGLPVVVWEEAAVARFVREREIGVTVRDLRELGQLAGRVYGQDYRRMVRHMSALRGAVRRGEFLRDALDELDQLPTPHGRGAFRRDSGVASSAP